MRVNGQSVKGNPIEQGVKGAERTDPFTEGSVKEDRQQDEPQQDAAFPGKQCAETGANACVAQSKRQSALQNAGGTDVFAEKWIGQSNLIDYRHRQYKDEKNQNAIFQIGQDVEGTSTDFFTGNFVQQLLKPSKRTEETADHAPQQDAKKDENADNIVGYMVLWGTNDRLQ